MTFVGMDPEAVRSLSDQLARHGEQVTEGTRRVDALTAEAEGAWEGADLVRFHDQWTSHHRPLLLAVSEALGHMVQTMRLNADQQEAASGSAGSGHSAPQPGGQFSPQGYSFPGFQISSDDWLSIANYIVNGEMLAPIPGDLGHWIQGHLSIAGLENLSGLGDALGALNNLSSAWAALDSGVGAYQDFANGDILGGIGGVLHSAGDAVSMTSTPYSYLGQLALHTTGMTFDALSEVDFDYTAETFSYMADNPGVIVESLGDSVVQVGGDLLGWVIP